MLKVRLAATLLVAASLSGCAAHETDRTTMAAVVKRVDSVSQSVTSLPIPKGIDPMRARAPRPR